MKKTGFRKRKYKKTRRSFKRKTKIYKEPYGSYFFKRTFTITSTSDYIATTFNTNTGTPNTGQAITFSNDAVALITGTTQSQFTYFSFGLSYCFGQLPAFTEFTGLYDRYMIMSVKLKLSPIATQSNSESVATGSGGQEAVGAWLYSVIDRDDNLAFTPANNTGVDAMRQYASFKMKNFLDPKYPGFNQYIRPRTAFAQIDTSGAVVGTGNVMHKWIDMGDVNIKHFGSKWMFEVFQPTIAASATLYFRPSITMYFKCKDLR